MRGLREPNTVPLITAEIENDEHIPGPMSANATDARFTFGSTY